MTAMFTANHSRQRSVDLPQSAIIEDKSQVIFKIKIYSVILKTDKKFVEMQNSLEYQVSRTCVCVCVCVCMWRAVLETTAFFMSRRFYYVCPIDET